MTGGGGLRVFRVQTDYAEPTQLAEKLAPFCGDDSVVLPGARGLSVGTVTRFSVALSSGIAVLSGRGQVLTVKGGTDDGDGSHVRVKVLEIDDESLSFWASLLSRRRSASRLPAPPPTPGAVGRPPALPAMEPAAHALAGVAKHTFFGEEARVSQDNEATVVAAAGVSGPAIDEASGGIVPHLAAPARMAGGVGRVTGKTLGYTPGHTGKVMVARKSNVPPWAAPLVTRFAAVAKAIWQRVPEDAQPAVARFGPWGAFWILGLLCGFWWAPKPTPVKDVALASVAAPVAPAAPVHAAPVPSRPIYDHCSVNFTTTPPGALVQWGDLSLGQTPLLGVTVPCGRTLVSFRLAGFEPLVATMTATLDGPVVFTQTLKRNEATLYLVSAPAGAEVRLDGKPAGSTPLSFAVPQGQPFELELEKPGYVPLKKTMRVTGQKALQLKLQPAKAKRAHPR
ncbi:MAG: PEGA domain-containing protein [Deltaproteobacteria bacterium]|nr:PEGA domain-containing protein [Deltaproteobacteria bacterium]